MFSSVKFLFKRTGFTLLLLTCGINFAWAENYEGYGSNPAEAREALAQHILINVKSKFEKEVKVTESSFLNTFSKSASNFSNQSSNVILTGVKTTQTEDGQFVAILSKEQFKKDAAQTLKNVIAVCETELPNAWQPKRQVLRQCVQDVDAAVSMAIVVGNQSDISRLSQLRTNIYNEHNKALIVIASTPEVGYSLDGETHKHANSHPVNSGEHTIIWQGNGYCKHQETFTVNAGEEVSFNPKLGKAPRFTFKSPNHDAKLTVNGKDATLGEVQLEQECHGVVSYSISNDYDAKGGKLTLKPNLNRIITQKLLTKEEAAKKKQQKEAAERKLKIRQQRTAVYTNSFKNLDAWQILYGYSAANNYENTHRLRLEKIKNFKALRYGWGVMYGSSENSKEYEAYAQAALQLPEVGGYPLSIYGWSFIPYAGAELGLGYHQRYNENDKTKIHKFAANSEFSRDRLVVRMLVGLDIPLSKDLAIKLQASKQTSMEKSLEFNLGASMRF